MIGNSCEQYAAEFYIVHIPTSEMNIRCTKPVLRHKIPEWFGLEGTLKATLFQLPALGRDAFHCPSSVQAPSNIEHSRDGAATVPLEMPGAPPGASKDTALPEGSLRAVHLARNVLWSVADLVLLL